MTKRQETLVSEQSRPRTLGSLGGTPISFCAQDAELTYVWFDNPPQAWGGDTIVGRRDQDLFPGPVAEDLLNAKRTVLHTGRGQKHELSVQATDGARYYDLYLQPDTDERGEVVGVATAIVDVTERRRSEAARHTLLREVTHRSKNLLAIVISLAAQTSRTAHSIEDFLDRFNGRLQSMSRSQDLVTEANWRGAQLRDLVTTQVAAFAEDRQRQVSFSGPDVYLKPNASLHVGLALHELAINSIRHGALADPNGMVSVAASRESLDDATADDTDLLIVWRETAVDGLTGPDQSEFGSVLLRRLVPLAVDGTARLVIRPTALSYSLSVARREYE